MQLRIAGITRESVVDGPGIRLVVYAQGCPHRCPGCHNPETHDLKGGYSVTADELIPQIAANKLLRGVTFSGGEPFLQAEAFATLGEAVKALGLDIVTYSGYTFEQLIMQAEPDIYRLLAVTDILVDGPYRHDLRDLRLAFRGSKNQRLVDVPASLTAGRAVLWGGVEEKLA